MTDAFKLLGLPDTATADEVKVAYKRLASAKHPDRGGSVEEFQELKEAYETAMAYALLPKSCNRCRGTGKVTVGSGFTTTKIVCPACGGTGEE